MIGIGIDIVELRRFRSAATLPRVAEYFLTSGELDEFGAHADPAEFLASRFAAKEAVIKAFPDRLSPHEFAITKTGERPGVTFLRPQHQRYRAYISISHSVDYAAGMAVVAER